MKTHDQIIQIIEALRVEAIHQAMAAGRSEQEANELPSVQAANALLDEEREARRAGGEAVPPC
jgi:hypothetical protein